MSIKLRTSDPAALKKTFDDAINGGDVVTWDFDSTKDYVHDTPQWKTCGYFKAEPFSDHLLLYLVINNSCTNKKGFFAEAHGAMVYSMIYHCYHKFNGFDVSEWPRAEDGDSAWS